MGKQRIIIDEADLHANNLTIEEFITLLTISFKVIPEDYLDSLLEKGLISPKSDNERILFTNRKGRLLLEDLFNKLPNGKISESDVETLATKMQELFPQGKKPGTGYYWRGNHAEIVRKLKGFYKKYGTKYSQEQILEATQKYIQYYNGSTTYMQLLKYFIWKQRDNGEEVSELASYLDNMTTETVVETSDWTTKLV